MISDHLSMNDSGAELSEASQEGNSVGALVDVQDLPGFKYRFLCCIFTTEAFLRIDEDFAARIHLRVSYPDNSVRLWYKNYRSDNVPSQILTFEIKGD